MRRHGMTVLTTLGVALLLTGCSSPAPAGSATGSTPTPAPAHAVDIHLTGADTAHLVSPIAVPCSGGVGNEGQPLLGVGLDAARTASGTEVALNLTIVGFKSEGTYEAASVWAADGSTAVTLDPNPSGPISQERFIAKTGTVTITSVQGAEFAGSIDATLVPESPTASPAQVEVSGHWSCLE